MAGYTTARYTRDLDPQVDAVDRSEFVADDGHAPDAGRITFVGVTDDDPKAPLRKWAFLTAGTGVDATNALFIDDRQVALDLAQALIDWVRS